MSAVVEFSEVTGPYVRVTVTGAADSDEAEQAAASHVAADEPSEWNDDRGNGEFEVVFRADAVRFTN